MQAEEQNLAFLPQDDQVCPDAFGNQNPPKFSLVILHTPILNINIQGT